MFIQNFKRKEVTSEDYFIALVTYIHQNPVNHRFTTKPEEWEYSSYHEIIEGYDEYVVGNELIKWFGDIDTFRQYHKINFYSGFDKDLE